jgi:hypothetical protein
MSTSLFQSVVKRLQAFGLLQMTISDYRLTENVFIASKVEKDDLVAGFLDSPIVKQICGLKVMPILVDLF